MEVHRNISIFITI